jgi:hypothetical protein
MGDEFALSRAKSLRLSIDCDARFDRAVLAGLSHGLVVLLIRWKKDARTQRMRCARAQKSPERSGPGAYSWMIRRAHRIR